MGDPVCHMHLLDEEVRMPDERWDEAPVRPPPAVERTPPIDGSSDAGANAGRYAPTPAGMTKRDARG